MQNVWKGLVVGGLTGVTAGVVLDSLSPRRRRPPSSVDRYAITPPRRRAWSTRCPTRPANGSTMPTSPTTSVTQLSGSRVPMRRTVSSRRAPMPCRPLDTSRGVPSDKRSVTPERKALGSHDGVA